MKLIGLIARFAAPAFVFAGPALAQSAATQNLSCSNGTLAGTYAFQLTGQILAPAAAIGSVAGVALTVFDGYGNLSQVDNVVHNGAAPIEDWRPATGTYTVNANCTGTFTGSNTAFCRCHRRLDDLDNRDRIAEYAAVHGGNHQHWR
jgi:hypothetical protein